MKRALLLLLLLLPNTPGCCPASISDHTILVAPETEDFPGIITALQQAGYEWAWISEGETAWIRWEAAHGKVVLRHYPQLKSVSVVRVLSKKKKAKVTTNFMIRLNYLNATGFLKGYLDTDSDMWLQAFYPLGSVFDLNDFQAFLSKFDELTGEVAREFSDYLQVAP